MKFSAFAIITFASAFVSSAPLAEPEANAMAVPNARAEALPFGHKKKMRKMMKTFRLRGTGNAYYPPGYNGASGNSSANSGGSTSSANSGGNGPVSSNSSGNTVNITIPPGSTITDKDGNIIYAPPSSSTSNSNSGSSLNNDNGNSNSNTANSSNNNDNGNNNNNENKNSVNTTIYILPHSGYLTGGVMVPGSVPFQGFVNNGILYASSPNNRVGQVVVNNNGQLQLVNQPSKNHSSGWVVQDGNLVPGGQTIMMCPDARGINFLYSGVECPGGGPIELSTNHEKVAEVSL